MMMGFLFGVLFFSMVFGSEGKVYVGVVKEVKGRDVIVDIKKSPKNDRCHGPVHIVVDPDTNIKPGDVVSLVLEENPCGAEFVRATSVNRAEGVEFEVPEED